MGAVCQEQRNEEKKEPAEGKERLIRVLEEENPANKHRVILLLSPGVLK